MKIQLSKPHVILAFVLLFTLSLSAQSKKIKGNGEIATKTIETGDYNGIKCAGSFDYILVKGAEGNIVVEGEKNLIDYVIAEVKDNTLKVKVKKGFWLKSSFDKPIKVTIPFEDVNSVSLSGSGDLWNEDTISANSLEVALSGSGDVVLDIETTDAEGKISGSGDLTLKGSTNNLIARVAGSGDFHGFDLESNNTDVAVSGSGDADVVSNQSIKARVAGSGDIDYKGNPEKVDGKVSGSGDISKS